MRQGFSLPYHYGKTKDNGCFARNISLDPVCIFDADHQGSKETSTSFNKQVAIRQLSVASA